MILAGRSLRHRVKIEPCMPRTEHLATGLTYGLGPATYDVRIAERITIGPGGFELASIIERLTMPNDVVGLVLDKSSWARRGLALQNTFIDPGWTGYLTVEMSNHGCELLTIASGTPIAQILFMLCDDECMPYDGRYQNQRQGPQKAIMKYSPLSDEPYEPKPPVVDQGI